ncbi:hemolysin family protein [Phaeobacter sp. J2-8]|uniref:hemolysin family protein n=1 Tax=Phaeobacter sp. J2-8 TaxID=2931394 RepID=UPI001FD1EAD0|nr:hemolysin family protein [Phaeobacter sp. J2-8]MCJ7872770.1 hemolysin family protein [Phaeobacter sp. J2-8]
MDDTDPPSNAAQRAQSEPQTIQKTGFFRRIFSAFRPTPVTPEVANGTSMPAPMPMTHGMINLRRLTVEDVAIPKADIVAVPVTITREDLLDVFRDSGLSRLPVYDGTLDTPLGMVHLKDFALKHGFNSGPGGRFALKAMMRPLLFVPPSMPIGVLLTKMQAERRHMALVIDEYGGVDGLATIEDLIEQVIGEIEDEHDVDEDKLWAQEKGGTYLALAKTPLDEFQAEIGIDLTATDAVDAEEIDTLGGLVFVLAGHVPARGEMVPHPDGPEFEVVDADPRRIKRLRVRLHSSPHPQAEAVELKAG